MRKSFHHILPKSRDGTDSEHNVINVDNNNHKNYHRLFANMTPEEVIDFLWTTFGFDRLYYRPLRRKAKKDEETLFIDPKIWWWDC
jgi:hypothetical protein